MRHDEARDVAVGPDFVGDARVALLVPDVVRVGPAHHQAPRRDVLDDVAGADLAAAADDARAGRDPAHGEAGIGLRAQVRARGELLAGFLRVPDAIQAAHDKMRNSFDS